VQWGAFRKLRAPLRFRLRLRFANETLSDQSDALPKVALHRPPPSRFYHSAILLLLVHCWSPDCPSIRLNSHCVSVSRIILRRPRGSGQNGTCTRTPGRGREGKIVSCLSLSLQHASRERRASLPLAFRKLYPQTRGRSRALSSRSRGRQPVNSSPVFPNGGMNGSANLRNERKLPLALTKRAPRTPGSSCRLLLLLILLSFYTTMN